MELSFHVIWSSVKTALAMVFIYQSLKIFFDQVRELISPDVLCMVEQGPNYILDILNKPVYIAVVVLGVFTTTTKP